MEYYKVFELELASFLCRKGHHMEGFEPHRRKPWLYVYSFEKTDRLLSDIRAYRASKRGEQ